MSTLVARACLQQCHSQLSPPGVVSDLELSARPRVYVLRGGPPSNVRSMCSSVKHLLLQVLLEENTMTAIKSRLAELLSRVTGRTSKYLASSDR